MNLAQAIGADVHERLAIASREALARRVALAQMVELARAASEAHKAESSALAPRPRHDVDPASGLRGRVLRVLAAAGKPLDVRSIAGRLRRAHQAVRFALRSSLRLGLVIERSVRLYPHDRRTRHVRLRSVSVFELTARGREAVK